MIVREHEGQLKILCHDVSFVVLQRFWLRAFVNKDRAKNFSAPPSFFASASICAATNRESISSFVIAMEKTVENWFTTFRIVVGSPYLLLLIMLAATFSLSVLKKSSPRFMPFR